MLPNVSATCTVNVCAPNVGVLFNVIVHVHLLVPFEYVTVHANVLVHQSNFISQLDPFVTHAHQSVILTSTATHEPFLYHVHAVGVFHV